MENIIDISTTISPASIVYPGDDPLVIERLCDVEDGCPCSILKLGWTTHFLTHVDPPRHFFKHGATLEEIPLGRFSGRALVIEVSGDRVEPDHVPDNVDLTGSNVLFKTKNSAAYPWLTFDEQHAYVTKEAAEKLVAKAVNLVGIDYIGIDRFGDETYPAHNMLLGNNVLILEGIHMEHVAAGGSYTLWALPLKIQGADGSPVRAVLVQGSLG